MSLIKRSDWLEKPDRPFRSLQRGRDAARHARRLLGASICRPVRAWLAVLFVSAPLIVAFSSPRCMLLDRAGWSIFCATSRRPPAVERPRHASCWRAARPCFVRPFVHFVHEILHQPDPGAAATNMIRWRTHLYTLGHSVGTTSRPISPAGWRTASRKAARRSVKSPCGPSTSLLYVAIFAFTAAGPVLARQSLARAADVAWDRRAIWPCCAISCREAKMRSLRVADTRSALVGRMVDSYTNILTVKLFARGAEERSAVRDSIASPHEGLPPIVPPDSPRMAVLDGHEQPCWSL